VTRAISVVGGGGSIWRLRLGSEKTISFDLFRFSVRASLSVYLFTVRVNLVYVKLWGLATKIKILIKNLHDSKGYGAKKTNESISWKKLEQKWTDMHRRVYQRQIHAKGGHFEYSIWTDNVDFVHICYIQCDLFDCCIFNYEIMPATFANTFLFILQGSALADLGCGGRF